MRPLTPTATAIDRRPTDGILRRPTLTGLLLAAPVAAVAAWYAVAVLGPNDEFAVDLGCVPRSCLCDRRAVAWAARGAIAREDFGTFSGLVAFTVIAHRVGARR